MNWTDEAAVAVEEATPGLFPVEIRELVAEYATLYSAGDWCLVKQLNVRGYKIGVITYVVMRGNGQVRLTKVHECGRVQSDSCSRYYSELVNAELAMMDAAQVHGPTSTLHAPRYRGSAWGANRQRGFVDVYTDTGRVPFAWLKPVILIAQYNYGRAVGRDQVHMVAAGTRVKMEALYQKMTRELGDVTCTEVGVADEHEVCDLTIGARNVRPRLA